MQTPRPQRPPFQKPPLRVFTTTLWEYPSQHYNAATGAMQGDKAYVGATPSWVIWQLLQRYTREGDVILDPMCGSGTTLDVAKDLGRKGVGFDLAPSRADIRAADARALPMADASVDFVFVDPPYSTHVDYSDDPACIGKLDAFEEAPAAGRNDRERSARAGKAGEGGGLNAYYAAMERVIGEMHRVLRDRRYMALYVSDSYKKVKGEKGGRFAPIGFELFGLLRRRFVPIDIVCVVRHNQKLGRGNWHKAAEEGNFFLRGFNYLFIMKKEEGRGS